MEKLVTVEEMIRIEQVADTSGQTYQMMMDAAGESLAEHILAAYSHFDLRRILGLIGSGNNGGDGLVAMTYLLQKGWQARAYLITDRTDDPLSIKFLQSGGEIFRLQEDLNLNTLKSMVSWSQVLLDSLLGTGFRLPLRQPVIKVLHSVWEALGGLEIVPKIIAVDCPSGINCDTGEAAYECLPADITVCMAAVKQGLLKLPAYRLLGNMVVGKIGLPEPFPEWEKIKRFVLDRDFVFKKIPHRKLDAHKGSFGTVMVVAGSRNYSGAALLAGKAAFRSGAGWVIMAVPEFLHPHMVGGFPEATWLPLPAENDGISKAAHEQVGDKLRKATALLVGPGLGLSAGIQYFLHELISTDLPPLVIDADGLKMLRKIDNWWERIPTNSILTPHPGEMSDMTGLSIKEIQQDRINIAEKYARLWGQIIVLKGAFTIVAKPEGETVVLPFASPVLARAGTGDVLGGIIAGLLAQKMNAFDAACAGIWLHAQAGLAAAKTKGSTAGVLAGDLIDELPRLMPY